MHAIQKLPKLTMKSLTKLYLQHAKVATATTVKTCKNFMLSVSDSTSFLFKRSKL